MEIDPEVMATIKRVVGIHAPCYKVVGYDLDDIKQEAFIMCFKILKNWDGERPLENFLAISLSNKLKTFIRDKHKLQGCFAEANQRVMSPLDLDNIDWDNESCLVTEDTVSIDVDYRDLVKRIDEYLPISLRRDYLLMKDGVRINRARQEKIRNFLSLLLKELRGDDDGEE